MSLPTKAETQLSYVPSGEEAGDIAFAQQFKHDCFQQVRAERIQWRRNYERYDLRRKLSDYDYIDDVPVALTYEAVERASGKLPGREFGFSVAPVGDEDTLEALKVGALLKRAWESPEIMDGPAKMKVVKKSMALFGTCPVQLYWDVKTDGNGKIIKSDPGFYPVHLFDFYANKHYAELEDCPEIGYITNVPFDQFKNMAKQLGFKNAETVKGIALSGSSSVDEDSTTVERSVDTGAQGTNRLRLVRIFEIQSNDEILTIALDPQPIWLRKVKNKLGRKNCVLFRWKRHPFPNRLYGVTDISSGALIEDAMQKAFNQAVFNSLLVDNPMFTYDRNDPGIDPRTFLAAPGAGIPRGNNRESIAPLIIPSHIGESIAMIQHMALRYERVVNVTPLQAGITSGQGTTATEMGILNQAVNESYDDVVDGMKDTFLKMAVLIREMYKQYGPDSLTLQITDPQLIQQFSKGQNTLTTQTAQSVELTKDSYSIDRDVTITVGFTSQNKALLSKRLIDFQSITAQDQSIPTRVRMSLYKQFLEFNDLDKLAQVFNESIEQNQTSDIALADQENTTMEQGRAIPPTPNASMAHTQRHVEFMRQYPGDSRIDQIFKAHIAGEIQQHQSAAGQSGQTGSEPQAEKTLAVSQASPSTNPVAEISTMQPQP